MKSNYVQQAARKAQFVSMLVAAIVFAPSSLAALSVVEGPIPGTVPGDRNSSLLEETYPFFSTPADLASNGYVEEEYYLTGEANAYATDGTLLASEIPYRTRILVRRPVEAAMFSGTVLMEWQNVTAGYDLDALWDSERVMRAGHSWIGVSAQRVGVDQLKGWSPTRYGSLNVTGGGAYMADQLSYDVFAQAAAAVREPIGVDALGGLTVQKILAIGASQSAGRMTVWGLPVAGRTSEREEPCGGLYPAGRCGSERARSGSVRDRGITFSSDAGRRQSPQLTTLLMSKLVRANSAALLRRCKLRRPEFKGVIAARAL